MSTKITDGIKVSVLTEYEKNYSCPLQAHYVFTYKITIENCSDNTIQLHRRLWNVHDSNGQTKQIEGEGVVGKKPILEPGEVHQYISGCNLRTGIGKMVGAYTMERLLDGKKFTVAIPEFTLMVPFLYN
ncbi:MAG: Co2+/Mg2+ efflux protein ApaG [Bacteroidetes bacterium]|nr:MAG: Co2+/Mg2+ efflux protein ApaG [Bacteroidota bacterium]TAG92326.1 MAG: Co2+/Mg2+ efflux protein ApaG [Bacteroidota bacterium]